MTRKLTFKDRRMQMLALADDVRNIADDMTRHAAILSDAVRFLEGEAKAMERAEARFAQRAETQKATPQSRPSSTN